VNWAMSTTFGLMIEFDFLKKWHQQFRNRKYYWAAAAAIFKNEYDVISPPRVNRFGLNLVLCRRMACRLLQYGRNHNREKNSNMVDVCFPKPEVAISQPLRYIDDIWFADRFWLLEECNIIRCETRSSTAPPWLPSWKSIRRHIFAAGVWCGWNLVCQDFETRTLYHVTATAV